MSLISEIFEQIESALKHAREAAAELEELKKKLRASPEFDDSDSADAERVINEARSNGD